MNKTINGTDHIFIENIFKSRLDKIRNLLMFKGQEYCSQSGDRFHNFNLGCITKGETAESYLLGLMNKQWISIIDAINDLEKDIEHPMEFWQEKIGDVIVYLILLESMKFCRDKERLDNVELNSILNCTRFKYFSGLTIEPPLPAHQTTSQECLSCKYFKNCRLEYLYGLE